MKCVYHLSRDVVLLNVISVGERAPPKVRLRGRRRRRRRRSRRKSRTSLGSCCCCCPRKCRPKQADWKTQGLVGRKLENIEMGGLQLKIRLCKEYEIWPSGKFYQYITLADVWDYIIVPYKISPKFEENIIISALNIHLQEHCSWNPHTV